MKRPSTGSGNASQFNSYQHGYQPPVFYAEHQTQTLEDTTKTYHQAEETSGHVLNQLQIQRNQLLNTHENVDNIKQISEIAKRELEELKRKYREKKQRLYLWIAILSITDALLFFRIIQCHGNFYCI